MAWQWTRPEYTPPPPLTERMRGPLPPPSSGYGRERGERKERMLGIWHKSYSRRRAVISQDDLLRVLNWSLSSSLSPSLLFCRPSVKERERERDPILSLLPHFHPWLGRRARPLSLLFARAVRPFLSPSSILFGKEEWRS